jgi:hypothetical protein
VSARITMTARYDKSLGGRHRDFHLILRTCYHPAACHGEPDAGKGVDAAGTGGMNNGAKPGGRRQEAIDFEARLVHQWRVTRLTGLGIPRPIAEAEASHVHWHQIASLVRRGCPPALALRIVR